MSELSGHYCLLCSHILLLVVCKVSSNDSPSCYSSVFLFPSSRRNGMVVGITTIIYIRMRSRISIGLVHCCHIHCTLLHSITGNL